MSILPASRTGRALLEAGLVFAAALAFFCWQFARWDGVVDFDGHYHIRVAQWIAHHGLWSDIPWLPFTVLGERGPDHHWLWHLALVPFTWIDDPSQALLWAAAANAAATVAVITLVLRLLGVPAAPLFALIAVAAGVPMPYRLLMLRAHNAALIFMMFSLWAMARGHHKALAAAAFLFLHSYHGGVLLAPMALIGAAVRSVTERRLVLAPVLAVGIGLTLALVISPWYPRNIEYLMFHLLYKTANPVHGEHVSSLIGSEWYPVGWRNVWLQSWPAHLTLAAALAGLAWRRMRDAKFRPSVDTLIAIGTAILCLGLYSQAVRFAEYYIPFAAVSAGLAVRDAWRPGRPVRLYAVALLAWTAVAASVGLTALQRAQLVPADHLADVGRRINELGKPGEVVFNSSWSDFMALVWWADAFRYINGLDGHYLAYRDPARFAVWYAAGLGLIDDPASVIAATFGARFVVVARPHAALAEQLKRSERARLHVASPYGWLFELR